MANSPEDEMLKKSFEIILISRTGSDIGDVGAEEMEGSPLIMDGKTIGFFSDVHKIQHFRASLKPSGPLPKALTEKLKRDGHQKIWMNWAAPEL